MDADAKPRSDGGLGKYQLVATLGQGGMGDVFLAVHRGPSGFSRLVVIKSMRRFAEDLESYRNMLLDEARLAARLRHPNVVQTFEVGETDGRPFIAMEYLDGQALNAIVARARKNNTPLGADFSTYIMREALAGLHYAHELEDYDGSKISVVHRDVSPHNIFVTYEGEVKVVDFGIAKATTNVAKTEAGGVKGKLAYLAPEQCRGEAIDRRVDVFAAGLVLWELITSRRLLEGDATAAVVNKLLHESMPSIEAACPGATPELEAVLRRALAKKADDRFPTAEAMQEALQPFLGKVERATLGRKVREMFEAERADMQSQIRRAMQPASDDHAATMTMSGPPALLLPDLSMPGVTSSSSSARPTTSSGGLATAAPVPVAPGPEASSNRKGRTKALALASLLAIPVIAAGVYAVQHNAAPVTGPSASRPGRGSAEAPAGPAGVVGLRLQGSETIGSQLAPALVEAFMKRNGASTSISRANDKTTRVVASFTGKAVPSIVEITSEGSATAFTALADGQADIGMSSRAITAEEDTRLKEKGLGELSDRASEHVIGLDAISVIVHPNNHTHALSFDQLGKIFHGDLTDWSSVDAHASAGPIVVYALDENSGTFGVLKHALGNETLVPGAKRFSRTISYPTASHTIQTRSDSWPPRRWEAPLRSPSSPTRERRCSQRRSPSRRRVIRSPADSISTHPNDRRLGWRKTW